MGVADYQCPHVERLVWSRESCGVIKSAEFEACHALVPPEDFYGRCVYDACSCDVGGDCECLCTAIADYASECSKKGVSVQWRSNERCPMQCDGGKQYKACGNPCADSCSSLNSPTPRHCQLIRQRFRSLISFGPRTRKPSSSFVDIFRRVLAKIFHRQPLFLRVIARQYAISLRINSGTHAFDSTPERIWLILVSQALHLPSAF